MREIHRHVDKDTPPMRPSVVRRSANNWRKRSTSTQTRRYRICARLWQTCTKHNTIVTYMRQQTMNFLFWLPLASTSWMSADVVAGICSNNNDIRDKIRHNTSTYFILTRLHFEFTRSHSGRQRWPHSAKGNWSVQVSTENKPRAATQARRNNVNASNTSRCSSANSAPFKVFIDCHWSIFCGLFSKV